MKILITGATGLIGNAVLETALKKKFKVNYLTRDKDKIKNSTDCNGFYWDVNNDYIDLKCFEGVNVIINLVGEKIFQKWTKKSKKEILSSRIKPIDLLMKGIKRSNEIGIRSFVSASAIGIYQNDFEKNYTENETVDPQNFIQKTVYEWEKKIYECQKINSSYLNTKNWFSLVKKKRISERDRLPYEVRNWNSIRIGQAMAELDSH